MITEDYCSYEVCKLLREKHFNEPCNSYFTDEINYYACIYTYDKITDINLGVFECLRPTHQMAMKWLREVHKICIVVYPFTHRERGTYTSDICTTTMTMEEGHLRGVWNTYEEAIEESIKYCLENLI